MKKQNKIRLNEINVQSFVTSLDSKLALTIKGGEETNTILSRGVDNVGFACKAPLSNGGGYCATNNPNAVHSGCRVLGDLN